MNDLLNKVRNFLTGSKGNSVNSSRPRPVQIQQTKINPILQTAANVQTRLQTGNILPKFKVNDVQKKYQEGYGQAPQNTKDFWGDVLHNATRELAGVKNAAPDVAKAGYNTVVADTFNNIYGKGITSPVSDVTDMTKRTVQGQQLPDYKELHSPQAKLGYQIGGKINPQQIKDRHINESIEEVLGNVGGTATPIVEAYGFKNVGGLVKDQLKDPGKVILRNMLKAGNVAGRNTALYSGATSLDRNRDKKLQDQALQAALDSVIGYGGGFVMGAGVSGGAQILQSGAHKISKQMISDEVSNLTPEVAKKQKIVNIKPAFDFIDESGRAVDGYVNMIRERGADDPKAANYINRITRKYLPELADLPEAQKADVWDSLLGLKHNTGYMLDNKDAINPALRDTVEHLFESGKKNMVQNAEKGFIKPDEFIPKKKPKIEETEMPKFTDDTAKMRGFPNTVKETLGTPEPVAENMGTEASHYYNVLHNKDVVSKVTKLIDNDEQSALQFARVGKDTEANATAMVLIDKYLKSGRFEEANQLIRDVSPRFTEQGQQVQILSLYGRLTPTGAVKFTQRLIDQANEANPKLGLKLTPDNIEKISGLAKNIEGLEEGSREYNVAVAKLLKEMVGNVPSSTLEKISAIQTMAQLLNPKTAIRNVFGNGVFAGLEQVSDVVGAGVDRVASSVTGKRSLVMPSASAQASGFKKGLMEGIDDALQGIDTGRGMRTKFDLPTHTFSENGNLAERTLAKAEKVLNIELRATDRAFYQAAFDGSLDNQMRAAGITEPTEKMIARAHYEGLYRTFQDNSAIAEVLSKIKSTANFGKEFGLGDMIMKYPKTPGNLVSRGLDYSPAGFVKAVYHMIKPVLDDNQRQVVQEFSRALVGSGLITAAGILASKGLLMGSGPKDKDMKAVDRSRGLSPYTINLSGLQRWFASGFTSDEATKARDGDMIINYDWMQPNAIELAIGANVATGNSEGDEQINAALDGLQSGVDTVVEQPVVQNYRRFAQTMADPNRGGLTRAIVDSAFSAPGSFAPSIANQAGQYMDTDENGGQIVRETYDTNPIKQGINQLESRIPVVRENLPQGVDVWGQPKVNQNVGNSNAIMRAFNVFVNPAYIKRYMETPEADLVLSIFEDTGETKQAPRSVPTKIKVNGVSMPLSPTARLAYQHLLGEKTKYAFRELTQNPDFMGLPSESKAKFMANLLTDINNQTKLELFQLYKGKNMPQDEAKTMNNTSQVIKTSQNQSGDFAVAKNNTSSTTVRSGRRIRVKKANTPKAPTFKIKKSNTLASAMRKSVKVKLKNPGDFLPKKSKQDTMFV